MKVLVTGDFCPQHRLKTLGEKLNIQSLADFLPVIQEVDLAITNLECPLTDAAQPIAKTGPTLKGEKTVAYFLKKAGFGLVTLANNHIMDYGTEGLKDTLDLLKNWGIQTVGVGLNSREAGSPYLYEKGALTLTILNFAENEWSTTSGDDPGANPIDPVENWRSIARAKANSDRVMVITHGGHEMYRLPSPRMKQLIRF